MKDVIIVGSGVSGSFIARYLTQHGMSCLMVEAGESLGRETFPTDELEASTRLYWGGGIELNSDASIGFLRAKVVGGGSIVNQALVDRFDETAWSSWREKSGVNFFCEQAMAAWYERAERELVIQTIPREAWNQNARLFEQGFERCGYRCAPLRRAQAGCRWEEGNDCIRCLYGCRRGSKQSMIETALKRALEGGLKLVPRFEAKRIGVAPDVCTVTGVHADGREESFCGARLVLAAGSIGNVQLLSQSGFAHLEALGQGFYSHPQYMSFARYEEPVEAHRGPFQGLKSDEPRFRADGFKLENVFAPPAGLALLLPRQGKAHRRLMKHIRHLACIEVAIRDTEPGTIEVDRAGKVRLLKRLNTEDRRRRDKGLQAVNTIFRSTGAKEILRGELPISLHLMGGCALGCDPKHSVVDPEFHVHGHKNFYIADSSVFPDAPGINPSLTIMALALRAAAQILKEAGIVTHATPEARAL